MILCKYFDLVNTIKLQNKQNNIILNDYEKPMDNKKHKKIYNYNNFSTITKNSNLYKTINLADLINIIIQKNNIYEGSYMLTLKVTNICRFKNNKVLINAFDMNKNIFDYNCDLENNFTLLLSNIDIQLMYIIKQLNFVVIICDKEFIYNNILYHTNQENNMILLEICFNKKYKNCNSPNLSNYMNINDLAKYILKDNFDISYDQNLCINNICIYSNIENYINDFFDIEFNSYLYYNILLNVNLKECKLSINNNNYEMFNKKANILFSNKKYISSIHLYSKAIDINPKYINALSNRSEAYLNIGCYNSALIDCINVLKIDNTHIKARYRKIKALEGLNSKEYLYTAYLNTLEINKYVKINKTKEINYENINSKESIDLKYDIIDKEILTIQNRLISQLNNQIDKGIFCSNDMLIEEKELENLSKTAFLVDNNSLYNLETDYYNNNIGEYLKKINELKATNFTSNKIKISIDNSTSNKGLGIYANNNIDQGELIIVEKPICCTNDDEINYLISLIKNKKILHNLNNKNESNLEYSDLIELIDTSSFLDKDYEQIVQHILVSKLYTKLKIEKYFILNNYLKLLYLKFQDAFTKNDKCYNYIIKNRRQLFKTLINIIIKQSHSKLINKECQQSMILEKLLAFIKTNCLNSIRNCTVNESKDLFYGIWPHSSLFNHSCEPNCFYYGIGPYLIIKAIKKIYIDEELCISYVGPLPYKYRIEAIKSKFNFICNCNLCKYESNMNTAIENTNLIKIEDALNNSLTIDYDKEFNKLNTYVINKLYCEEDIINIKIFKYTNDKIFLLKHNLAKNNIYSYSMLSAFYKISKEGKLFLKNLINWIDKAVELSNSNTIESSDMYKNDEENHKKIFKNVLLNSKDNFTCVKFDLNNKQSDKNNNELTNYSWYNEFLFYKFLTEVLNYSDLKEYKMYCYQKCIDLTIKNNIREAFEIAINMEHYCSSEIFKLSYIDLKKSINNMYNILYNIS